MCPKSLKISLIALISFSSVGFDISYICHIGILAFRLMLAIKKGSQVTKAALTDGFDAFSADQV